MRSGPQLLSRTPVQEPRAVVTRRIAVSARPGPGRGRGCAAGAVPNGSIAEQGKPRRSCELQQIPSTLRLKQTRLCIRKRIRLL
jgi:hypothetical protein